MGRIEKLLSIAYEVEVERRGMKYIENEQTNKAISELAQALTQDNYRTGILMCGTCGNGKTTMLLALQNTLIYLKGKKIIANGMPIIDARDIETNLINSRKFPMLAVEDMGKEPATKLDYGNIRNPMVELLEYRYDNQLYTVVTTNLTPKEIRQRYGVRIADRFNEMMNVIIFTGKSFRK